MARASSPPWCSTACALVASLVLVLSAVRSVTIDFAGYDRDYRFGVEQGEARVGWQRPSRLPLGGAEFGCQRLFRPQCLLNWRPYHEAEAPFPYPSAFRYLRIPLWPLVSLLTLLCAFRWGEFRTVRRGRTLCYECGYPLGGIPVLRNTRRCPECGSSNPAHQAEPKTNLMRITSESPSVAGTYCCPTDTGNRTATGDSN